VTHAPSQLLSLNTKSFKKLGSPVPLMTGPFLSLRQLCLCLTAPGMFLLKAQWPPRCQALVIPCPRLTRPGGIFLGSQDTFSWPPLRLILWFMNRQLPSLLLSSWQGSQNLLATPISKNSPAQGTVCYL
jgi:hypothetical protein